MEQYEVTQKILAIGPTYQIRKPGTDEVLMTVKGKILSMTPKLTMVEGGEGAEMAVMKANFFKTKFAIAGADGKEIATLAFPMLQIKKGFSLAVGGQEYKAEGGFLGGKFKCADGAGQPVFEIEKQLSLKDKFLVTLHGTVPPIVALMSAVAIDQKFFQEDYID
jgi:uncharacterized protein YxjI